MSLKTETTLFFLKIKRWFRRFSWRAGVEDAIFRLHQEKLWTPEAQGKPTELRSSRFLEMQYAANSLTYLLNKGFE